MSISMISDLDRAPHVRDILSEIPTRFFSHAYITFMF